MADTAGLALVLKDGSGGYYAIPWSVLEQSRAPAEMTEELEEALAGDVAGCSTLAGSASALGTVGGAPSSSPTGFVVGGILAVGGFLGRVSGG